MSATEQLTLFEAEISVKSIRQSKEYVPQFPEEVKRLQLGYAVVWSVAGKMYAAGDFEHIPTDDIWHNIRILRDILLRHPRKSGYSCFLATGIIELSKDDIKRARRMGNKVYQWSELGRYWMEA